MSEGHLIAGDVARSAPSRLRLESLTGLRFFAALLVFCHHTFSSSIVSHGLARVHGTDRLARTGVIGVTFFFVLSGFVLSWSYDARPGVGGFLGRRLSRIWPLHALAFVVAALVLLPALDRPRTGAGPLAAGLLLVQAWVPDPTYYFGGNGPSWSLSCEVFFYATLPFLVSGFSRLGRRAGWAGVGAAFVVLVIVPPVVHAVFSDPFRVLSLWVFPPYRFFEFLIGVIAGTAMSRGWRPRWSVAPALVAVVGAYGLAAATLGTTYKDPVVSVRAYESVYSDAFLVLPLAALICAVAAVDASGRRSWLRAPLMVRLGAASFAFYLVHSMVVLLAAKASPGFHRLHGLPLTALALGVSLVLAEALHRSVERPVEAALRRRLVEHEARRRR